MEYRLYNGDIYKYHLLWDNGTKGVAKNTIEECFANQLYATSISTWY